MFRGLAILNLFFILFAGVATGQTCYDGGYPMGDHSFSVGHYNRKGRLIVTAKHRTDSVQESIGGQKASMHVTWVKHETSEKWEAPYYYGCFDGVGKTSLLVWLYDPLLVKFQKVDRKINEKGMLTPVKSAGAPMPKAQLEVELHKDGFPFSTVRYHVSDYEIIGEDTVVAGGQSYGAIAVKFRLTTRVGDDPPFPVYVNCKGWYVRGTGFVRVEQWHKKGYLLRYAELLP